MLSAIQGIQVIREIHIYIGERSFDPKTCVGVGNMFTNVRKDRIIENMIPSIYTHSELKIP